MVHPIVYLTCELKGRDLASRLLIAQGLVRRGYPVVVGQQWSIFCNVRSAPPGAILFKTANKTQGEWMAECAQHGFAVVASDEESLASAPADAARMLDPLAASSCDIFLAMHPQHRDALAVAYPEFAGKIRVAGSARIDLLRSSRTERPLSERYILINTSFGMVNHLTGDIQKAVGLWIGSGGHEFDDATGRMVDDRVSFERGALAETLALIDWLLVSTGLKIVLRPHPTERVETWRERYGHSPRVLAIMGSDPTAWMKHAEIVIHSESTTGVEAAVLGARALNLSPPSPWRERLIVASVNVTRGSAAEAGELIGAYLKTGAWPLPDLDADSFFPVGGAEAAAEAIASRLPPPRAVPAFEWQKIRLTDMQRGKFSASLDEVAGQVSCTVAEIDESLFALTP